MVRAYIFVKVTPGEVDSVLDAVIDQDPVTEAHVVAGDFDVIAETEAPEVSDLLRSAAGNIRNLSGVTDTRTYVCLV